MCSDSKATKKDKSDLSVFSEEYEHDVLKPEHMSVRSFRRVIGNTFFFRTDKTKKNADKEM